MDTKMVGMGERIKKIRGGMSQDAFAKKLGVSRGAIGNYEAEQQVPGGAFIANLCVYFNVQPRWLLQGKGPMYDTGAASAAEQDRNIYMDDNAARIADLERELSLAQERLQMKEEMHADAREQIAYLKDELKIARLERDKANQESSKATYLALKAAYPDMQIPAQATEFPTKGHSIVGESASSAPSTGRSND